MKAFGPRPWGPALPPGGVDMVPTPVGSPCLWCGEPVAEGESGVIMPYVKKVVRKPDEKGQGGLVLVEQVAEHRECLLRQTLGSVGHQLHECSCYGGTREDPEGLTKREAAREAVRLFESRVN